MRDSTSIANKLRRSYFIFAVLLCAAFVSIFVAAEIKVERALVESRLLQQLQLSQAQYGLQDIYVAEPGIKIYRFDVAPAALQKEVTTTVQEKPVMADGHETSLHFFTYQQKQQRYILTYLQDTNLSPENYPVLAIFEYFEDIFDKALLAAIVLSLLVAILFSYLSSKQIIKPLLDLKSAVESDHQNLTQLTHLPSEVGVLARAIADKNHELAYYLKREQLFTGDVSHELRTPLTIIMGASEVLAAQLPPDSRLLTFADRINTTAKETSEIISALLLLSRAPEKLDAPLTSISTIANAEVERLSYLLRHKSVTCQVSAKQDYTAYVRPELLKMALGNLIKNAFQYTDEGQVTVIIDADKIAVSDTGLGIPSEMVSVLYERFTRLEHSTTASSLNPNDSQHLTDESNSMGMGLGLSIVQRIMTHLDWRLTHEANSAGGSTFIIHYNSQPPAETNPIDQLH